MVRARRVWIYKHGILEEGATLDLPPEVLHVGDTRAALPSHASLDGEAPALGHASRPGQPGPTASVVERSDGGGCVTPSQAPQRRLPQPQPLRPRPASAPTGARGAKAASGPGVGASPTAQRRRAASKPTSFAPSTSQSGAHDSQSRPQPRKVRPASAPAPASAEGRARVNVDAPQQARAAACGAPSHRPASAAASSRSGKFVVSPAGRPFSGSRVFRSEGSGSGSNIRGGGYSSGRDVPCFDRGDSPGWARPLADKTTGA